MICLFAFREFMRGFSAVPNDEASKWLSIMFLVCFILCIMMDYTIIERIRKK